MFLKNLCLLICNEKNGFKASLRDFISLYGTFKKGPFLWKILTIVGLESNNGIYPLAYDIVEYENTQR